MAALGARIECRHILPGFLGLQGGRIGPPEQFVSRLQPAVISAGERREKVLTVLDIRITFFIKDRLLTSQGGTRHVKRCGILRVASGQSESDLAVSIE